jgi:plastocyanin
MAVAVASVVLGACGDGGPEEAAPERPKTVVGKGPRHVVTITNAGYEPADLTIAVGDRVKFVNASKDRPHSAQDESRGDIDPSPESDGVTDHSGKDVNYASKRGFATHSLFPGEPQAVVFRVPRTYRYHCTFHPDMRAVLRVVDRGASKRSRNR